MEGTAIDGEIIMLKDGKEVAGRGSSEVNKVMLSAPEKCKALLEEYKKEGIEVGYAAYDILYYRGACVKQDKLTLRKASLEQALCDYDNSIRNTGIPFHRMILVIPTLGCTQEMLDNTLAEGREGMMLKQKDSIYQEDVRSKDRHKIKRIASYDGVIMGYKKGTGKYKHSIGALHIGQYFDNGDDTVTLKEVCTISGMSDAERTVYRHTVDLLLEDGRITEHAKSYRLHDPTDVVEFVAQEKTKARYRHPRFIMNREDKNLLDCTF
jgi:ATP-dependent DNA ligase